MTTKKQECDRLTSIEKRLEQLEARLAQGETMPGSITDVIRQEIAASGLTTYALSKRAGLSTAALDRWLKDPSRDLSGESINKLARALGLRLTK